MSEKFWFGKNQPLTSETLPSKPEEAINSEGVNLSGSSSPPASPPDNCNPVPLTTGNNNQQSDDDREVQRIEKAMKATAPGTNARKMLEEKYGIQEQPLETEKSQQESDNNENSEGNNTGGSGSNSQSNQQSDNQEISGGPAPGPDPFVNLRNKYGGGSTETEQPQTSEISEQPNNQQSNAETSEGGNI